MRCAHGLQFTSPGQHTGQPGWSHDQRCRVTSAEELDTQIPLCDVGEHSRYQAQSVEVVTIGAQRHFILGAAIDEFEYGARQPPPREVSQRFYVDRIHEVLSRARTGAVLIVMLHATDVMKSPLCADQGRSGFLPQKIGVSYERAAARSSRYREGSISHAYSLSRLSIFCTRSGSSSVRLLSSDGSSPTL